MKHDRHPSSKLGLLGSVGGLGLLVFLGVGGFLLIYEHRAHVFSGDGLLVGLLALCVGVHLFMHHRHGDAASKDRDDD